MTEKTREQKIQDKIWEIIEEEISKLVEAPDNETAIFSPFMVIDMEKVMVNLKARIDDVLNKHEAIMIYIP